MAGDVDRYRLRPADPIGHRADQAAIRRNNLSLVLRRLRAQGPRSRARIATETGLNKATVSNLVADLIGRGLARDGSLQAVRTVGRPGQDVELDGHRVCAIGLELNVDYAAAIALDLGGDVVFHRRIGVDVPALSRAAVLDRLAALATEALAVIAARGAATFGVTMAIPGLVDVDRGHLEIAPNVGWRDVPVVAELRGRLASPTYPIRLDNDANLSALGEHAMGEFAGTDEMVYLTGEVGVGGGVIAGGRLLRGASGYSGEVGHLPLDPAGHRCGCGRHGCWETMVGLGALLRAAADDDDPVRDPALDLEERLAEMCRRANAGDPRTLHALESIGTGLGFGASILANLFNPHVIMLGGYFASLGPFLLDPLHRELERRVMAPHVGGARVELSRLGFTAAIRGGAQLALDDVVADPTLVSERTTARN